MQFEADKSQFKIPLDSKKVCQTQPNGLEYIKLQ